MGRAALLVLAALVAGCTSTAKPATPHASSAQPSAHVFLIVMENHSAEQALQGPFVASLATTYGVANDYHAVAHPSVPNYLALSSGSTWGVSDDSFHDLPRQDLGTELTTAGVSWRAYMEGLTEAGCANSPLPYDPGHNPFLYYGGQCPANVVPLSAFDADLAGKTPRFSWITPDRCHDTHDCDVSAGDDWLKQEVGQITASQAWKSNGVLFITWDEDDRQDGSNQVLTLVIQSKAGHRTSARPYTHYSLLATIEDILGVKRLGESAQATPMTDLLPY